MANPPKEDLTPDSDGGIVKTILKVGEGSKPSSGCIVNIHYAYTIEDTVIDSRQEGRDSFKFKLGEDSVIKAWNIGIASMREGELARFDCKPQYICGGDKSFPKMDSDQSLIFDIEMISWWNNDLSPNNDFAILKRILKEGEGSSTPNDGTLVDIHLTGIHEGTPFDDRDVIFCLGKGSQRGICKGVEVALRHFKLKEKSVLQIKSMYAFGAEDNKNSEIPSDADIEFIVSLDNFREKPSKCLPGVDRSFRDIIQCKRTYVDKTEYLAHLISSESTFYMLFRPRRFGKSVFLETLESYFSGEEDLFKDLLITTQHPECKCEKYPVIKIDFCNRVCSTLEQLLQFLEDELSLVAVKNGIELKSKSVEGQFTELIYKMATSVDNQYERVVILIDECDHPLRKYGNDDEYLAIVKKMTAFYSTIKKMEEYVRFCLLVGVTNLVANEVFSGFNIITSLNEFEESFAAVVGFTEDELKQHFDVHLRELALSFKCKPAQVYDYIRSRYNGFRFTDSTITVYNPCSIIRYIKSKGREKSFFSQSGGSSYFEKQILKKGNFAHTLFRRAVLNCLQNDVSKLNIVVPAGVLYGADPVDLDSDNGWAVMFFQIGLLTIHDVRSKGYQLKFSNLEYQQFYLRTLSKTVSKKCSELTDLAEKVKNIILSSKKDWFDFINKVDSFLAAFPCSMLNADRDTESVFELIMYILLDKMGFDVDIQPSTIAGSANLVATDGDENLTLIWELEIENNNRRDALHQSEASYLRRFLNRNKDVLCMGIQFSRVTHGLVKFGVAKYDETGTLYFRQPYECVPKKVTLRLKDTSNIDGDTI